jgi:TnpA family transposase
VREARPQEGWSKYPGKNIISMLALDLLLHSMVFIKTLILQQILEKPEWHANLRPP